MASGDDLMEIFELARRALECQAELGHKELILEAPRPLLPMALTENPADSPSPAAFPAPQSSIFGEEKPAALSVAQYSSLDEHQAAICHCTNCPLGATRTKFVYGVGSPKAKIMFIGEAPGRDEDLQGEPFVGRAGKLLDRILEAMKLSRQEVYIANILKCRPPENRDPQPEEMEKCLPYLEEQVRLLRPVVICALGRIAAHGLLGTNAPLGKLRGRWHDYHGVPMIVTYHPAALLRFAQYKRPTWEDMQELLARYEQFVRG